MNYPLISEYVQSIKFSEENFDKLSNLRPVLDADSNPIMSSGNFAVVFKMEDRQSRKLYAVKCFLREQEGRDESYRLIASELEYVSSTYLTPIQYLEKELFVDTTQGNDTEYPVLLMDRVEGLTLDKYIRKNIHDPYKLALITYQFCRMGSWLLSQEFAHGDLKPDNIIVREDGQLVLVDYDGMFVPAMRGQKSRELGSVDYCHPLRTEDVFNGSIDDFSIASIALSLKAISLKPELLNDFGAEDRLLFRAMDYQDLGNSECIKAIQSFTNNMELYQLLGLFYLALARTELCDVSSKLFNILKPESCNSVLSQDLHWLIRILNQIYVFINNNFDSFWWSDFSTQLELINKYNKAINVERNNEKVVEWWYNTFYQNDIHAQLMLGFCYEYGIFVHQNILKSFEYYFRTAYLGCSEAEYKLEQFKREYDIDDVVDFELNECLETGYSSDGKKFMSYSDYYESELTIKEGTEILCNNCLNDLYYEIDTLYLETLYLPSTLKRIGTNVFCASISNIICKSKNFKIENEFLLSADNRTLVRYFGNQSIVNIPDGVIFIKGGAFSDMDIQKIIIPQSVKCIGDNPFAGIIDLKLISYSKKLKILDNILYDIIEKRVICYLGNDENICIQEGMKILGANSFYGKGIKQVRLPQSIEYIDEIAFGWCFDLKEIIIPKKDKLSIIPNYLKNIVREI